MLGKLLKYDLKWKFKLLVVFYILSFIFSTIGRVCIEIENSLIFNVIGQIFLGASVSMMISILINTFMRSWVGFIRSLYKDESYLTHTLPIERGKIYLSKIISSIITTVTSIIVIIICLLINYYSKETFEWLKQSIEFAANAYDSTVVKFIVIVVITILAEILFALFAGFLGIILGHKSNNRRTIKSILFGFFAYMIPSAFTLITIYVVGIFNPDVMNLFNTTQLPDINTIKTILYAGIAMYMLYVILYYFIGKAQFKKGVNVD